MVNFMSQHGFREEYQILELISLSKNLRPKQDKQNKFSLQLNSSDLTLIRDFSMLHNKELLNRPGVMHYLFTIHTYMDLQVVDSRQLTHNK